MIQLMGAPRKFDSTSLMLIGFAYCRSVLQLDAGSDFMLSLSISESGKDSHDGSELSCLGTIRVRLLSSELWEDSLDAERGRSLILFSCIYVVLPLESCVVWCVRIKTFSILDPGESLRWTTAFIFFLYSPAKTLDSPLGLLNGDGSEPLLARVPPPLFLKDGDLSSEGGNLRLSYDSALSMESKDPSILRYLTYF